MNVKNLLRELIDERQRLDDAIAALQRLNSTSVWNRKTRFSGGKDKKGDSAERVKGSDAQNSGEENKTNVIAFPTKPNCESEAGAC